MSGKNSKRKMNRRQVVMIEWAVLIAAAVLIAVLGIWFLASRLNARKEAGSAQQASGIQKTQEAAADAAEDKAAGDDADGSAQPDSESVTEALTDTEAAVSGPKNSWLFSFAGDCTIGSLLEWQGSLAQDF